MKLYRQKMDVQCKLDAAKLGAVNSEAQTNKNYLTNQQIKKFYPKDINNWSESKKTLYTNLLETSKKTPSKRDKKSWYSDDDFEVFGGVKDSYWDFLNPFSLEFRGMNELYGMIMWKLMFVFFFLLVLCLYVGVMVGLAYISQWDKVKKMFKEEWVIMSPLQVFFAIDREEQEKWLLYEDSINNSDIKVGKKKNALSGVLPKIGIFYSKIDKIFTSNSYWVYYSKLEFIWTLLPCIILLLISVPSFTLALALDETHKPASWIKVIGNQWFWVYEYSTYSNNIIIYSNIVYGSDLTNNALRAIETDCVVTIVNNKFTRFLVTSSDVIHCWAVPSLGIKIDACPGRINSVSVLPTRPGVYYGQCSEICGVNHAFMPICVEVVV